MKSLICLFLLLIIIMASASSHRGTFALPSQKDMVIEPQSTTIQ